MSDLVNALLCAAGVTAGFALWMHVKQQKPVKPPHVHEYEAIIRLEYDKDLLPPEKNFRSADYPFLVCACGSTAELLMGPTVDGEVEAMPVYLQDWKEWEQ